MRAASEVAKQVGRHVTRAACCCRYFYRSRSDYGVVENSPEATKSDEAVLEAELDLDKLAGSKDTGSPSPGDQSSGGPGDKA